MDVFQENHVFVFSETGHRVSLPQAPLESMADLPQQLVSGFAPQAVVYDLEAVQVYVEQRKYAAFLRRSTGDGLFHPVPEQHPLRGPSPGTGNQKLRLLCSWNKILLRRRGGSLWEIFWIIRNLFLEHNPSAHPHSRFGATGGPIQGKSSCHPQAPSQLPYTEYRGIPIDVRGAAKCTPLPESDKKGHTQNS